VALGESARRHREAAASRRRRSEYLYGDRDWSQTRIAEALSVSQKTISRDLELVTVTNSKKGRRGRPRGSKTTPKKRGISTATGSPTVRTRASEARVTHQVFPTALSATLRAR
jgi:hypothetical protein